MKLSLSKEDYVTKSWCFELKYNFNKNCESPKIPIVCLFSWTIASFTSVFRCDTWKV